MKLLSNMLKLTTNIVIRYVIVLFCRGQVGDGGDLNLSNDNYI